MAGEILDIKGLKPTALENLYCTLAFLGSCDKEALQCYQYTADRVAGSSFSVSFDRIVLRKKQAMLWAVASSVPAGLELLHSQLVTELACCSYQQEGRAFIPHVTLARKVNGYQETGIWQTM